MQILINSQTHTNSDSIQNQLNQQQPNQLTQLNQQNKTIRSNPKPIISNPQTSSQSYQSAQLTPNTLKTPQNIQLTKTNMQPIQNTILNTINTQKNIDSEEASQKEIKKDYQKIYQQFISPTLQELYIQKKFGDYYDIFNNMEIKINSDRKVTILHKNFTETLINAIKNKMNNNLSEYDVLFKNTNEINQSIKQILISKTIEKSNLYTKFKQYNLNHTINDLFFDNKSLIINK